MPSEIPGFLIEAFPPKADWLLARTAGLVTDEMLARISKADYGYESQKNLDALREIRDLGQVPSPLPGVPQEVLELVRWAEPDQPNEKHWFVGERGHIARAFCCAALLRAAADSENDAQIFFENQNDTLIQLIRSAIPLRRELPEAAASFITSRLPNVAETDVLNPFFAFGLVGLALIATPQKFSPRDVDTLAAWLEDVERAVLAPASDPMSGFFDEVAFDGGFLTLAYYDQKHGAWQALAAEVRSRFAQSQRLDALMQRIEQSRRRRQVERQIYRSKKRPR
jgi:hypothetical protein